MSDLKVKSRAPGSKSRNDGVESRILDLKSRNNGVESRGVLNRATMVESRAPRVRNRATMVENHASWIRNRAPRVLNRAPQFRKSNPPWHSVLLYCGFSGVIWFATVLICVRVYHVFLHEMAAVPMTHPHAQDLRPLQNRVHP